MNAVVRSTDKEHKWAAWAGTKEELKRIGKAVEEEAEKRRTTVLAAYDSRTEAILASYPSNTLDLSAMGRKQIDELGRKIGRDSLSDRLRLDTILVEGDTTVRGSVDQIIQELDRRETDSLEFLMDSASDRLKVETKSKGREWGVRLNVASTDTGWANQVYVHLSEEIDKGEPTWSWMRKRLGRVVISLFTPLVFVVALDLALLPSLTKLGTVILYSLSPWIFLLLFAVLWATERLHDWLLPRFEIVADSGTSTGGRRLTWIGTMAATLAVGVIVYLITR